MSQLERDEKLSAQFEEQRQTIIRMYACKLPGSDVPVMCPDPPHKIAYPTLPVALKAARAFTYLDPAHPAGAHPCRIPDSDHWHTTTHEGLYDETIWP